MSCNGLHQDDASASYRLEVPPVRLFAVGKRRQHVERPYVQHHVCTVTRRLQTASQDFPLFSFLPGHLDMTYLSLLIIIIVFFSGIFHGPCNNWHYLDHVKHVDDGDDDDDALAEGGVARSVNKSRPSLSEAMLDYVPVK